MEKKVLTVCPYCGSGCNLYLVVEGGKVVRAEPAKGRNNEGKLCLKGYYGWDFLNDPKLLTSRLKKPMIRKNGVLEEVSWDEAIKFTAENLMKIKAQYGPDAIMGTGSARGPGNEPNYIMQKFMRAAIGTNNIDHCARVCHGPSVAGLDYSLGGAAMSNSIPEIEDTDVVFVFGYNPSETHPIVARRIVKAREKGAKIIVADPRKIETVKISDLWLQLKGGTNMALVNALGNVLINEELYDEKFVENCTEGFEEYKEAVKKYTPEYAEKITGVSAEYIRKAMRIYAKAKKATILYGMGVCQFSQAVDVVKGLASLALLTGNLGRPNVGIGPVRGQNNVQGTCDMGVLPNRFPGYQSVTDEKAREKFEKAWGVKLSDRVGYFLTEVPKHVLKEDKIKAYYIFGEDPAQSDPNAAEVREALDKIDFVIVQDIFMNKTALHADVVLPATSWGEHDGVYSAADRSFQRIRKAVEPMGEAKDDWEIICEISTAMGYPMHYNNTEEIWNEMRSLCPKFAGASYEKMEKQGAVPWPCTSEEDPGTDYLYDDGKFMTENGRGKLFACEWRHPFELTDEKYPLVLSTVREIGHYSVRTMTGNCRTLQKLADEPGYIEISVEDAKELNIKDQELVTVSSRRGKIITRAAVAERVKKGATYMTYQWWVGACNELTIDSLDPISKTPEFKYCAVKVERIKDQQKAEQEIEERYSSLKKQMKAE
ncbi:formate dehydrogenase H [Clostridium pasteurianum DSM 525 = ATCC 6013]|uniref:Formate dehydrogenase H n=1 Tax=Clostridium pasteurianum DSM 525 = ATCC 6013 TaxID=1262449 RepID=A0A0H3IZZ5_CLOPA|nr:formate dehydrogenase subunit alpha [Clostridium pasteurianum]AJA47126.1 formate dehydrogenase H [Clostridium pasteurianum DSM 525 = ATCC 6013]AJA51114.1 formate dehydrogenase H [Clostridium pasteurianum DSM 525 = ATCC 6013]AOZ74487.1 formate dehydrogenase [Clostridium pasteurianum DSM 525 = ATCC 6013]AOZ78284.1 formate dehydrogenase [Clostridium pasteurianum]ELP59485.1 formate dehydrogenase subunit alpha [Clostridium pasteurianum DSM 525 = ATCC 6013]